MSTVAVERGEVHDVVGVGFGPSNLALAIAFAERPAADRPRAVFLERQPSFGWHRGMMLPDATMQVSFLKDLVTLRNPVSRYSFLSYLHDRGRLVDFVNQGSRFPSRAEFHDYLGWAQAGVQANVDYGTELVDVRPVMRGGIVRWWDAVARHVSGDEVVYRARNVVLAAGITPNMPHGTVRSDRIWHSADFLHRLGELTDRPATRFAVIGAGQSAAEITGYLHQRFAEAEVYAIMSRYGYSRADDSAFANRVFDPHTVDEFFHAPPEVARKFYSYHGNTNYSVVDDDLIAELYRRHYQEKVHGRQRLHFVNLAEVTSVDPADDQVTLKVQSLATNVVRELHVDVVVHATGYRPMDPVRLLNTAAGYCQADENGQLRVRRDYRVVTKPDVHAGIYLQGGTEYTHGLSASLLSNVAVRAGEIAASVSTRRP